MLHRHKVVEQNKRNGAKKLPKTFTFISSRSGETYL